MTHSLPPQCDLVLPLPADDARRRAADVLPSDRKVGAQSRPPPQPAPVRPHFAVRRTGRYCRTRAL